MLKPLAMLYLVIVFVYCKESIVYCIYIGLQRMKSDSAEVRSLVQAIAMKLVLLEVEMDSKGIGSALYGLL